MGSNPTLSAISIQEVRSPQVHTRFGFSERCPSWLKEHDWKSCVRSKGVPRVRIPPSPPDQGVYPIVARVHPLLTCWSCITDLSGGVSDSHALTPIADRHRTVSARLRGNNRRLKNPARAVYQRVRQENMSYLVLARKYRPRTFEDVVGQDHVVRPLENALKSGRIAHAYLFSGARGVGKTTAARLLAMALNCRVEPGERPCGKCDSCVETAEGQAVDVFEVDGASNRGINEIRELRETIRYLPSKGRYKVYIIDEVHMLTKEAFNALLKTLEEPPDHVIFIFATTEAHKVLPTILSRCQRYDFKRIGVETLIGRMESIAGMEGISIGPAALRLLAREADGSLRDALSLFDQVIAFSGLTVRDEDVGQALGLIDRTLIAGFVEAVLGGDAGTAFDLLDEAYNFGYDTKEFAAQVLGHLRSLVVFKVSRSPERILDILESEADELREFADRISLETLNFHFNAWLEVQGRLHRATQPRLILEALVVKLAQVEPLRPLAELTARLEALLSGIGEPDSDMSGGPRGGTPGRETPGASRRSPRAGAEAGPERPSPPRQALSRDAAPTRAEREDSAAVEAKEGVWPEFVEKMRPDNPLLFQFLEPVTVKAFNSSRVDLVVMHKNGADLLDRERLLALLADYFGRRPQLLIQYEEGAAAEAPKREAGPAGEAEKKEILNHPLVQEARQIFPGEVIDIIPES